MSGRFASAVAFGLSLIAVLAAAVALQSFAEVLNRRFDLTAEKALSLSPHGVSVLGEVSKPLRIDYFYRRGERQKGYELLELMRDHCPELTYELVDLDRNPGRARDHGVNHYDRAVLIYDGRQVVVAASDEESLIGGVSRVIHPRDRVVYLTTGHNERGIVPGKNDDYGRAAQMLRTEGYEVRTLSLLRQPNVPEDASLVVVAGPEVDPVEVELERLDAYLDGGGSVLVLVDPVELPVLVQWLAKRGIALRDDVVIDRQNRVYGSDGTNAVVPFYREHDAVKSVQIPAVLGRARSVGLVVDAEDDPATRSHIVARTANESFAARGAERSRKGDVEMDPARDTSGPVGVIAVAATGDDPARAGHIAVVGDADFPSDSYLPLLGNKDLFLSLVGWLVSDRSSGPRPRAEINRLGPVSPVYVSDRHSQVIFLVAVIAQPLVFLLAGVAVTISRRRRR